MGDIESEGDLRAAIQVSSCNCVINLAGVYAWWLPDPSLFHRVNTNGVRNLLQAVSAFGNQVEQLVHISTVLAYGRPTGRGLSEATAFDEDCMPGPTTSLYAASKQAGDALVRAALASRHIAGCICYLACCIGADHKLLDPKRDVMRISELISGQLPAKIASDTVFTYVYVRDAAEAIVRASERRHQRGNFEVSAAVGAAAATHMAVDGSVGRGSAAWSSSCLLVGEGRLATSEYYNLIASVSGTPRPTREVPAWLAVLGSGMLTMCATYVTGRQPTAPLDLVRTATSGTLLFDASRSTARLGMKYTPIRVAFAEAIDFITEATTGSNSVASQAEEREGLIEQERT
eukprot:CAMPEP_0119339920 /NCGR_PEP_ID=MMETSP1333-20130426/99321_1 /TAXON_ID=418940 /ORGANISM="Scyphosphaera apsteinii, Strain RCC1455" /LENGTH=345 /DNA_ID=CAMNT_0007351553 /DNA_START=213 /DNA_END=1250 /DNA_ORIENTATION=+